MTQILFTLSPTDEELDLYGIITITINVMNHGEWSLQIMDCCLGQHSIVTHHTTNRQVQRHQPSCSGLIIALSKNCWFAAERKSFESSNVHVSEHKKCYMCSTTLDQHHWLRHSKFRRHFFDVLTKKSFMDSQVSFDALSIQWKTQKRKNLNGSRQGKSHRRADPLFCSI
jgi:hypothetical protein